MENVYDFWKKLKESFDKWNKDGLHAYAMVEKYPANELLSLGINSINPRLSKLENKVQVLEAHINKTG